MTTYFTPAAVISVENTAALAEKECLSEQSARSKFKLTGKVKLDCIYNGS